MIIQKLILKLVLHLAARLVVLNFKCRKSFHIVAFQDGRESDIIALANYFNKFMHTAVLSILEVIAVSSIYGYSSDLSSRTGNFENLYYDQAITK